MKNSMLQTIVLSRQEQTKHIIFKTQKNNTILKRKSQEKTRLEDFKTHNRKNYNLTIY